MGRKQEIQLNSQQCLTSCSIASMSAPSLLGSTPEIVFKSPYHAPTDFRLQVSCSCACMCTCKCIIIICCHNYCVCVCV